MKIAEALSMRIEHQKKVQELLQRAQRNLRVQEGEEPIEDPNVLIIEIEQLNLKVNELIKKINRANAHYQFNDEMTLSDALVDRETLLKRKQILMQIITEASQIEMRYSRTEIKMVTVVDVPKLQKELDELNKRLLLLENNIQKLNWKFDVEF